MDIGSKIFNYILHLSKDQLFNYYMRNINDHYYPEDNQLLNVFMNNPMTPIKAHKKRKMLTSDIEKTKPIKQENPYLAIASSSVAHSFASSQALHQFDNQDEDNKITKTEIKRKNRKPMIKAEARCYFPSIPIYHKFESERFYECSLCGYTCQRVRANWKAHKCDYSTFDIEYVWNYEQGFQNTLTNQEIPQSIHYQQLLGLLRHNITRQRMPCQQILQKIGLYPKWLKEFDELRNNSGQAKVKIKAKQWIYEGKRIAKQLKTTNVQLNAELQAFVSFSDKLNATGYRNQQLQKMRDQAVQEIWQAFKPTVESFTKGEIKRVLNNKFSIDQITRKTILSSLISQQQQMSIQDNIIDFHSTLQSYLKQKIISIRKRFNDPNQILPKTIRQVQRQTKGAEFLKSIPQTILTSKRLLIQRFKLASSKNIQITSISILNKLIDISGMEIPKISRHIVQKPMRRQKIRVTIDQIRNSVITILNHQTYQKALGVDLWFSFCLGLRLNDLERVYIRIDDRKYFDYIGLIEQKNRHNAIRAVPRSLKILAFYYNIQYPISKFRLKNLINFCKEKFGGFYILRHACLTNTLTKLMQWSSFRPHESTKTTLKYYIDYNNYDLIDNAFSLAISNSICHQVHSRSYAIGRFGLPHDPVIREVIQKSLQSQIVLPSTINFKKTLAQELAITSVLKNPLIQNLISIRPIPLTSQEGILSIVLESQSYQTLSSIYKLTYCSFFQLLSTQTNIKILIITPNHCFIFKPQKDEDYQWPCFDSLSMDQDSSEQNDNQNNLNNKYCSFPRNDLEKYRNQSQPSGEKNQSDGEVSLINEEQDYQQHNFHQPIYLQKNIYSSGPKVVEESPKQKQLLQIQRSLMKDGLKTIISEPSQITLLASQKNLKPIFCLIKKPANPLKIRYSSQEYFSKRIAEAALKKHKNMITRDSFCRACKQPLQTRRALSDSRFRSYCECDFSDVQDKDKNQVLKSRYSQSKTFFKADICILNSKYGIFDTDKIYLPHFKKLPPSSPNFVEEECKRSKRKYIQTMHSSPSIKSLLLLPWQTVTKKMAEIINEVRLCQRKLPLKIMECQNKAKGLGVFATSDLRQSTVIGTYLGIVRPSTEILQQDDSLLSIGWLQREEYFICCKQAANIGRYFNSSKKPNMILKLVLLSKDMFCPYFITTRRILEDEELTWSYGKSYWDKQ